MKLHTTSFLLVSRTSLMCQHDSISLQHAKSPKPRKSWYQKAMEFANIWRFPSTTKSNNDMLENSNNKQQLPSRLRKSASLKIASSFTRVCLCAPISSYNEVFRSDHHHHHHQATKRSNTYPRSKSFKASWDRISNTTSTASAAGTATITTASRSSVDYGMSRRVFRGKSLTDDVFMRRFVIAEEAMVQMRRRNNQMEFVKRRNAMRRKKIGPSPLSKMTVADDHCLQEN